MSGVSINLNLEPDRCWCFRRPRDIWGEPLPRKEAITDAKGQTQWVVMDGEWWNQTRLRELFDWLGICVDRLVVLLGKDRHEPERPMREWFLQFLEAEAPAVCLRRYGEHLDKWGDRDVAEALALRPNFLLELVELGHLPSPGDLVPPRFKRPRPQPLAEGAI